MNSNLMLGVFSALLMIYLTTDFSQRIMLEDWENGIVETSATSSEWAKLQPLKPAFLTEVLAGLEQYDVVVKKVAKPTPVLDKRGMSLTEQSNQQGTLDKIYAGDIIMTLKGTVNKTVHYALIQEEHLKTNQITIKKITVGDEIHGYSLKQVEQKQAFLAAGERTIDLMLYRVNPVNHD